MRILLCMTKILLLLFYCVLLCGCSTTKRVHRKGFHVKWNMSYPNRTPVSCIDCKIAFDIPEVVSFVESQNGKIPSTEVIDNFDGECEEKVTEDIDQKGSKLSQSSFVFIAMKTSNNEKEWLSTQNEDEYKKDPKGERRQFPLALFIVVIIGLLIPFLIVNGFLGYLIWAFISLLIGTSLITEILFWFIAVLFISLAFFWLSYLLYSRVYSDDPFYENKQSKFKRDFWKLAVSIHLTFLLLLGLVLFV